MTVKRVAFVCSEAAPWCKTGGLGDVGGALPRALAEAGGPALRLGVFLPLYAQVRAHADAAGLHLEPTGVDVVLPGGARACWRVVRRPGVPDHYFLEAPELFERPGGLYGGAGSSAYGGPAYPDNPVRFGAFCAAVLDGAAALLGGELDVVHCHDWQAAAIPGLLAGRARRPRTVLTIHNLAYQGWFTAEQGRALGLSDGVLDGPYRVGGSWSMLKGAIALADDVSTVSPGYAEEICGPALGCGLDGLLASRGVRGVLNGIDVDAWDPATDPHLPARFGPGDLAGKRACRSALLAEVGLPYEPGDIVLGVVSRLATQKGLDLLLELVPRLGDLGARLVLLGTGDPALEAAFAELADKHRYRFAARLDFDVALAHRIIAGADAFLMPSRFEPCGLNQLYSMRYGTLPIVHATGGLRDTVVDPGDAGMAEGEGTGFSFSGLTADNLIGVVRRAAEVFRRRPEVWARVQANGMVRDWSWGRAAATWLSVYDGR